MAIDKLVDSTILNAGLTDIADAIREKGGTSAELAFPQGFVQAIEGISSVSQDMSVSDKQVKIRFEVYNFDNRKIYISFLQSVAYGCTIDWGDSSIESSSAVENGDVYTATVYEHQYNTDGEKVITITVNNGILTIFGQYSPGSRLIASPFGFANTTKCMTGAYVYKMRVKEIAIGEQIKLGDMAFSNYPCIKINRCFEPGDIVYNKYSNSGFQFIEIPEGKTTIKSYAFSESSFYGIKFPSTIRTIEEAAFKNCKNPTAYDFTAVPLVDGAFPVTLGSANVFNGLQNTTAKILFATEEIANAAKNATNWAYWGEYITYAGEES